MQIKIVTFWTISLAMMCLSCIKEDDSSAEVINYVEVGDLVPDFSVSDGIGNTFSSSFFVGKRSLLVLFSTTCGDCQRELPKVNKIWEELRDDPFYRVITIAREQNKEITDMYWNDEDFTMPKYLDPDRSVFSLFASSTIPRLYIINEEGVIEWMAIEVLTITSEELLAKIKHSGKD